MRLSTITHLAYAVTLVLTAISASTFILSARSASQERTAIQQHLELDDLAEELAIVAESRTDEARLYVMRGDEQHLARFYVDDDQEGHLEDGIAKLSNLGISPEEKAMFDRIRNAADAIDKIEKEAISAYRAGRQSDAQEALFGDEHYRLQTELLKQVEEVRASVTTRSQVAVDAPRPEAISSATLRNPCWF